LFDQQLKEIFHQNTDVIQKIKASNHIGHLFDEYSPILNDVGGKCLNFLKLKKIQEEIPQFELPKSIIIPMTIPVHMAIKEADIYNKIKNILKQIDEVKIVNGRNYNEL
jgi:hypothetical protein